MLKVLRLLSPDSDPGAAALSNDVAETFGLNLSDPAPAEPTAPEPIPVEPAPAAGDSPAEPVTPEPAPAAPVVPIQVAEPQPAPEPAPAAPSELDELRQANEQLRQQLNEMARMFMGGPAPAAPAAAPVSPATQPAPAASASPAAAPVQVPAAPGSAPVAQAPYITPEQHSEIFQDPEKMNAVFSRVRKDAFEDARAFMLQHMPAMMQNVAQNQVVLYEQSREFYRQNPDLAGCQDFVAYTAAMLQSRDPGMAIDALYKQTATEVRKALKIMAAQNAAASPAPAAAAPAAAPAPARPAFARGTGGNGPGRVSGRQLTELEADVAETLGLRL